uniref:NRPS-PKS n=1 Tax=Nostoc sp. 'Peltigera membranacea cyanobiont' TaxID=414689 RepID=M4T749_9NOSO|nr:NRPS-PKS [Nostoc sp. 'Peltigera membranacea cyanobiont']
MNQITEYSTLVDLLQYRALHQPQQTAYTFLKDGEREAGSITYQELDQRAKAIAAHLQSLGTLGERALLLYPQGLEFIAAFCGCLYAGVIAIPAPPPDQARLKRTLPRLQAIATDAQASLVLTTSDILSQLQDAQKQILEFRAMRWLASEEINSQLAQQWQQPDINSDTLTYLQYTSGSTSMPKGVMISHQNLIHHCSSLSQTCEYTPDSVTVTWMPYFHDYGLVEGLIQPLYVGIPCYLMSPLAFIKRPIRWLKAISRYKATHSQGPNFAYDYCNRKITAEQRATLDLSSWCAAGNAAEPINPTVLESFFQTFKSSGFQWNASCPAYGLAEATLLVSFSSQQNLPIIGNFSAASLEENRIVEASNYQQSVRKVVGCGQLVGNTKVTIVNPQNLTRCASDEVGEIWVSNASVALGYWNKPDETEDTFRAYLADTGEGPFLRTGDLGFLKDGELFVCGRLKDLIIIGGVNHYPQDIEWRVEQSHPSIRPDHCAAFSVEIEGEEKLILVAEVDRRTQQDIDDVVSAILQAVAEYHELEVYAISLLKKGSILKTSSGKIQRRACRKAFLEGSLEVVKEWNRGDKKDISGESQPPKSKVHLSEEEIQDWLIAQLVHRLNISPTQIDIREPFARYGLASREAVSLVGELEEWLVCELSPTLLWEYPTIKALARHFTGKTDSSVTLNSDNKRWLQTEAIAIIGIGCRFPGAKKPEEFWQLLCEGRVAVTQVPPERWDVDAFYDPNLESDNKMNTRWGGFLEDVDKFDPLFFGISSHEASAMDPQQRLLLEVAWEALENAGVAPNQLMGSQTGVFVGISSQDYYKLMLNAPKRAATGISNSIAANRLSYFLDLRGPSMAVDTACSSSLVAVHLACQSLRTREANLALAGGVNIILSPEWNVTFSQAGMMASDGLCKSFDAAADGYVRGEGCGMVVLKRLRDALKDGDNILAVIRGSAVNQDGRSNGLTAPNGLAQQAVIRQALDNADLLPNQIDYIEAHGSGTPLGDVIEVQSLAEVLGQGQYPADGYATPAQKCALGSVKTNIGHLEAAAGIAGLIKVVLSLQHGKIPPHPHLKEINPRIALEKTPFVIPTIDQPSDIKPCFVGLSSFGFGGTNAHVVLEATPADWKFPLADAALRNMEEKSEIVESKNLTSQIPNPKSIERPLHLLTISARSDVALKQLAERYESHLAANPDQLLPDICFTANTGRSHFDHRLVIVAEEADTLRQQLGNFTSGKETDGTLAGRIGDLKRSKIAFLFTGQGSQYIGMARQLYNTQPTFREALNQCDELLRPYQSESLLSVLYPESEQSSLLDNTAYAQPALFALEYALAQLWQSWGIKPDAVMGHSVGEYVAACIAGVFSLEDGLRLIAERGRLMGSLSSEGTMAAIFAEEALVLEAIAPYQNAISIAAVNGFTQTVISGTRQAVEAVLERLEEDCITTHRLNVSHAFHSHLMEPILNTFKETASSVQFLAPTLPLISNVTGQMVQPQELLDASYWCNHIRQPVRFYQGMQTLADAGYEFFLEIGSTDTMIGMGKRCLPKGTGTWLASLKKDESEWRSLLDSLATLYVSGWEINWTEFDRHYPRRRVALPTYPFQRKRCWLEPSEIKSYSKKGI